MAQQVIGQGPGNKIPDTETKMFLANGAIVKGDVVGLSDATGYTVDQATATTILPIGVAAETAADGDWFEVIVSGFCDFVTNDGTDVVALDFLIAVAGAAVPKTLAEAQIDAGGVGWLRQIFGQSLEAETSTTCTAVMIFKQI